MIGQCLPHFQDRRSDAGLEVDYDVRGSDAPRDVIPQHQRVPVLELWFCSVQGARSPRALYTCAPAELCSKVTRARAWGA